MDERNIPITKEEATSFARHIYRDIAAYIKEHKEEYQEFLAQQNYEEKEQGNGGKKKNHIEKK